MMNSMTLKRLYFKIEKKIRFSTKKQIAFLMELGSWLNDGVKPLDAIVGMQKIFAVHGKQNSFEAKAAQSMYRSLDQGHELYKGMEGIFDDYLVAIFKSAETSGIASVLRSLKQDIDELQQLKMAFIKPIILPVSYLLVMFGSSVTIVTKTFPALAKGKPPERWPEMAQSFQAQILFVLDYWWIIIITLVFLFLFIQHFLTHRVGEWRKEVDELFGFNTFRVYSGNVFLKMLSSLLQSNTALKESLDLIIKNSTPYIGYHAKKSMTKLDYGHSDLGVVLDTGLITGDVLIKMGYLTH